MQSPVSFSDLHVCAQCDRRSRHHRLPLSFLPFPLLLLFALTVTIAITVSAQLLLIEREGCDPTTTRCIQLNPWVLLGRGKSSSSSSSRGGAPVLRSSSSDSISLRHSPGGILQYCIDQCLSPLWSSSSHKSCRSPLCSLSPCSCI